MKEIAVAVSAAAVRLLVVDDQAIMLEKLRQLLAGVDEFEVRFERDPSRAVEAALGFRPTVILQDLMMPDVSGFELIQRYRAHASLAKVPVVVLSAMDAPRLKEQSFGSGADDYLVKLPDPIELVARLRYHSAMYARTLAYDAAVEQLELQQRELTIANVELEMLSGNDSLTGLPNRRRLDQILQTEWQRGCRTGQPLSVLMCDVDHFKRFNDSFGHLEGDACLAKVATALAATLKRPGDLAARFGGEEFTVVLPDTNARGAQQVAEACRQHLVDLGFKAPGPDGTIVTVSIGVATIVPTSSEHWDCLLKRADAALYLAKESGRNRVCCAELV